MREHELDDRSARRPPPSPKAPTSSPATPGAAVLQLQAAAGNAAVAALVEDEERAAGTQVREVLASGGRPLDDTVRSEVETHLGADLSHVRVHDDGPAAASARAVQAQAYTSGSHVVFGEGKYDPVSADGRHRLAHELTHVVQQQHGPVDGAQTAGGLAISDPGDRFEQAADATAKAFVERAPIQRAAGDDEDEEQAGLQLQRAEDDDQEESTAPLG